MKLVYLASPYLYRGPTEVSVGVTCTQPYQPLIRHIDPIAIQEERYQKAIDATAYLMSKGLAVYSPIVATHPVAVKHDLPLGSEYWMQFDELVLIKCDEIVVLMLDGWKESPGVTKEIQIMQDLDKDVTYLHPYLVENYLGDNQ